MNSELENEKPFVLCQPKITFVWPLPEVIESDWLKEHFFYPTEKKPNELTQNGYLRKDVIFCHILVRPDPLSLRISEEPVEYPLRLKFQNSIWLELTFGPYPFTRERNGIKTRYLISRLRTFKLFLEKKTLEEEKFTTLRNYASFYPLLATCLDHAKKKVDFVHLLHRDMFHFKRNLLDITNFLSFLHYDNNFVILPDPIKRIHPNEFSFLNFVARADIRLALNTLTMDLVLCFDAHYCPICFELHTQNQLLCEICSHIDL